MNLSKDSLRSITYAAFVMAAVDGFMDDREITMISTFAQAHWQPEFGQIDGFIRAIDEQIVFFFESLGEESIKNKLFEDILPQMSAQEKTILIDLMVDVMQADGVIEGEELELLEMLKRS